MLTKRIYDAKDLERWRADVAAKKEDVNPPKIDHLEIGHTGLHASQNFSTGLVAAGMLAGWLSISGDKLTIKAEPEDLVYTIKRAPGLYCCFDGTPCADAQIAQAYIAKHFAGKKSPDPTNQAGYERLNAYECELDAKLHAKYGAPEGTPPALMLSMDYWRARRAPKKEARRG